MKRRKSVEKQILELSGLGLNNTEIANFLSIDDTTLKRNYEKFLTKGRDILKKKLRKKQIEVAMKGNATMLIWLGKVLLGQKEDPLDLANFTIVVNRKVIK